MSTTKEESVSLSSIVTCVINSDVAGLRSRMDNLVVGQSLRTSLVSVCKYCLQEPTEMDMFRLLWDKVAPQATTDDAVSFFRYTQMSKLNEVLSVIRDDVDLSRATQTMLSPNSPIHFDLEEIPQLLDIIVPHLSQEQQFLLSKTAIEKHIHSPVLVSVMQKYELKEHVAHVTRENKPQSPKM